MKTFETTFRGYDKEQVDSYIAELTNRYDATLREQKERIFSLVDELSSTKEQLGHYKLDEQAIAQSLVESQRLANEMRCDAQKFSDLTLRRAKVFYATWQTYAKTLMATLTDSEVKQFNVLSDKISNLIELYQGKAPQEVAMDMPIHINMDKPSDDSVSQIANPLRRVEKMSQQTIDPREVLRSDVPLEQVCKDLGLIE